MSHTADVRILMPCFDVDPQHLDEAIASVRAQTYPGWELVIVDDGSTRPETLRRLTDLEAEADARISVIRQPNAGPAAARNRAAAGASTTFLLSLDADDHISETFLELVVAAAEASPDVCAVYPTTKKFGAVTETVVGDEFSMHTMLERNLIPVTALVRRDDFERIGGFDERMRDGLEDHEFFLHLLEATRQPALKMADAVLRYRIRENSRNEEAHADLARMYAARGMLMAKHGGLYVERPELVYASELRFREECLEWRARYGRVERLKGLLRLDRFAPHIG